MEWFRIVIRRFLRANEEMSAKDFFLPQGPTAPGGKSAIPKRLKFKLGKSSNIDEAQEAAKHHVFDLEASRYTCKIQLEEDLPKRMIEQLRHIIGDEPVNPRVRRSWDFVAEDIAYSPVRSETNIYMILLSFWDVIVEHFRHLYPADECDFISSKSTRDQRVCIDVRIKMGSKTAVLAQTLDPALADGYTADLVDLASGKRPSSFEGDLPEIFYAHEGVLARVTLISFSLYL
jgi:hypothetical protein